LADLRAEIANLMIIGEDFSEQFVRPGQHAARNHTSFCISGKTVDLFQHPIMFEPLSKIAGRWEHTSTLFVRNVHPSDVRVAEGITTDLCHLLSFATMSEVRPFVFSYEHHWRRWSSDGIISQFRPPIEPDGEAIRKYVERTWKAYRRLKRIRKLPELIHYLTLADHPDQPLEVRMLLAFVALENMKGTWALAAGIPFRRGSFVRPVHSTRRGLDWRRIGFEELLNGMFEAAGMSPALRRIVRVRNQIVHFGLTTRKFGANAAYYHRTKALQHEYLLRLLGYKGSYNDYRTLARRRL
jgi:hypothetical protein